VAETDGVAAADPEATDPDAASDGLVDGDEQAASRVRVSAAVAHRTAVRIGPV
jgi:hypothetical protein